MSNFFQRVVGWIANEAVTKSLANSAWFQRFAQHTHKHVTKASKTGKETMDSFTKSSTFKETQEKLNESAAKAKSFGSSFMDRVKENYKRLEEEGKRLEEAERRNRK